MSLVVLLGGALAVNAAAAAPGSSPVAVPPAPPPLPVPTANSTCQPEVDPLCTTTTTPARPSPGTQLPLPTDPPSTLPPCDPTLPVQPCQPTNTPGGTAPTTSSTPCTGEGCIPEPTTSAPPTGPGSPGTGQQSQSENGDESGDADCGLTDIDGCITNALNGFFRGIVTAALNPLLDLLSKTLLTTPTPDSLPRIGELWNNSWQILLASYALLVLIAGILVMGYQTLQTRHSVKEIAPRIVVGFLAGALSLWVATQAIQIANALAQAVMGGGVDTSQPMVGPGRALKDMILGSLTGGIWIILLGIFLAGMLVVLLVTYVVRVALTLILIAGAPLALMFHALPQTEGIAHWWWKAFGGCLAIQVVQSLTLATAMRVLFAPGGFTMFGPNVSGLVNLLVAMALMYILFKIPFWILRSLRVGNGRSLVGSLARGWLAYKTFGLLGRRGSGGGSGGGGQRSRSSNGRRDSRGSVDSPATDRDARAFATAGGQYMLPLTGVRRRPTVKPKPAHSAPKRRAGPGRQLTLPLGNDWPENRPVLGRDGQYRLPLNVERATPTTARVAPGQSEIGGRRRRGRQLEFPIDPYKGNRATRSGQYPLPLDGVQKQRRTPRQTSPPPPAAPPPPRMRAKQLELPFDPYKGNRTNRGGQYPLPLDGLRRIAPAKPAPATPAMPPPRPAPPAGRQLRLPLDLPKPPRRTSPPKSGGKS